MATTDANGNEMTPEAVAAAGEYMAAIRAFSQAAYRLNSAWDALQSEDYDAETGEGEFEGYPFAESFDEMAVRIATWENAVTIKRYADMRVVPAAGDEAAKNG